MEDVIRKTPPSGFALNVGAALRRRWRWDLVLMAQHCFACYFFLSFIFFFPPTSLFSFIFIQNRFSGEEVGSWGGEGRGVMRTLSHSSSVKASRSTLEVNLVHP